MSPPLLEVRGVTVRHGGLVALHDVSLDLLAGEVTGLIGPNGAGKTTFIDALSGFTPTSAGSVLLDGRCVDGLAAHERARAGITRTFQSMELFEDLTVAQNLTVAAVPPRRWSWLRDLLPPPSSGVADSVAEVVERVGLGADLDRRPSELSNGRRHLVSLARALVSRPRLVLLDEPAAGLDPNETAELARVVADLPGSGTAVLLVDHDMSIVLSTCHTVHVLDFGGLIASGPPEQIRHDPSVISAYLGTAGHDA